MLASINAPDGPASPALASLYAPPRTRVAQVIETVPGWRGFGHVRRIAIAANGCLLVLLAGVFLLVCSSYADGPARALWVAIPATAPLLNVLGLWPCRTWRPLRVLLLWPIWRGSARSRGSSRRCSSRSTRGWRTRGA